MSNSIEDATSTYSQDADRSLASASEVVAWLHTPKQPKNFLGLLIWIAMLISLGLHALLLLVPMPEAEPAPAKPEERQVRITQLPTLTRPASNRAPVARSTPRPTSPRPRPMQQSTTIPPIVRPSPIAQSAQPAQPQVNQATPSEPVAASDANPWQDFPQYPGAQAGCYNLQSCLQTGRALNEVSSFFERELASKRYTATATITESDRKVYQVTRNNLTQFLSLINVPGQGTLYVLAEAPRTLADLGGAIEVPAEIYNVLSGLAATDATPSEFVQLDAFFQGGTVRADIGIMQTVTGEAPETFFDAYLRTNLVNNGFESTQLSQNYGGGLLYEVKKENSSLYVNLVPTQDGSGTIVVIWKTLPQ